MEGAQIPGPLAPLAMASYDLHREMCGAVVEASGIDYEYRVVSLIHAAMDDGEMEALRTSYELFEAGPREFTGEWLTAQEAREAEPLFSPEIGRAVRLTGNAALDSYKLTQALKRAAEGQGATFRKGAVNGLEIGGDGVAGVILADGKLACGALVMATGPWAREAETWLDISIPVDPLKGETLRMDMPGARPVHDLSGGGVSVTPKPNGQVWCGTTEVWEGFDRQPSDGARQTIHEKAVRLVPQVANAWLVQQTACLRPVTPDWLPIVGRAPGWGNVFLATGAGKKGVLLAPGIGKATADLISEGETTLPIGVCDPSRFAPAAKQGG